MVKKGGSLPLAKEMLDWFAGIMEITLGWRQFSETGMSEGLEGFKLQHHLLEIIREQTEWILFFNGETIIRGIIAMVFHVFS